MAFSQSPVKIALLKYNGGGDWYANPTSLPNLVKFCNANLGTNINTDIATVEPGSSDIFNYPLIHMTGHGNVIFSDQEAENLRQYMLGGGFLHIDDNYGLDVYVRPQIKKIFPEYELIEIPFNHAIYHQQYDFPNGLPKIHEHDGLPPKGYGIVVDGRIVLFYTHECDLGDGWESPDVHNDSQETRTKALQMGANIIRYVFNGD
ncbi:hypothetical protein SDC9_48751 [bioreactor metagenome]|uniref:DUF4159 domain-containing protein n=1 Tax=bioreactor metagenome TaxID=1076179 RepID=A0A644WFF8_9ZZZZ